MDFFDEYGKDLVFLGIIHVVCFSASWALTFRNGRYKSCMHSVSVAMVSSFSAVGVIAVVSSVKAMAFRFGLGIALLISVSGQRPIEDIVTKVLSGAGFGRTNDKIRKR